VAEAPETAPASDATGEPAAAAELRRALARTEELAHQEALRVEALLDRLEAARARAQDLAEASIALCEPLRRAIREAFARLLGSAGWRMGRAMGNGLARLRGRPLWALTEAAESECRAFSESAGAAFGAEPWTREQEARLERLSGLASLLLGSRRYRAGRLLARLLGWDREGELAARELACLLRVAGEQVTAVRAVQDADPEGPPGAESAR
jgi:hypothetical protein